MCPRGDRCPPDTHRRDAAGPVHAHHTASAARGGAIRSCALPGRVIGDWRSRIPARPRWRPRWQCICAPFRPDGTHIVRSSEIFGPRILAYLAGRDHGSRRDHCHCLLWRQSPDRKGGVGSLGAMSLCPLRSAPCQPISPGCIRRAGTPHVHLGMRLRRETVVIRHEPRNGHATRTLRQVNGRGRRRRISQDENEQAGYPKCGSAKKPCLCGVAIIVPDC